MGQATAHPNRALISSEDVQGTFMALATKPLDRLIHPLSPWPDFTSVLAFCFTKGSILVARHHITGGSRPTGGTLMEDRRLAIRTMRIRMLVPDSMKPHGALQKRI